MVPNITNDEKFYRAVSVVLKHEGGFSNHSADPGGATNFGISLRYLIGAGKIDLDDDGFHDLDLDQDGDLDEADVLGMAEDDARRVYRAMFWDPYPFDQLPLSIAIKAFDLAVNMGHRQAFKLLQRACRANHIDLKADGILGPKSVEAVNQIAKIQNGAMEAVLLASLKGEAVSFYRLLAQKQPKLKPFLKGWERRAYS